MTDKEFKRLKRSDLFDIIYQLQQEAEVLQKENEELKQKLESKRVKLKKVGSIAEASLCLTEVFSEAQKAADNYISEVRTIKAAIEKKKQFYIDQAKKEAESIIEEAESECMAMRKKAQEECRKMRGEGEECETAETDTEEKDDPECVQSSSEEEVAE